MRTQLIIFLVLKFMLFSCGTVNGTLNGTGSILEGIASDARQLGNVFKYWISICELIKYILSIFSVHNKN